MRVTDPACPFCGETQALTTTTPVSRATRAALVFGATVLVAGTSVACSSTTTSDAGSDATPAALYGGPPLVDAATDTSPATLYGGGPVDASPPVDAAKDAQEDASPAPLYGAVPVDSGRD